MLLLTLTSINANSDLEETIENTASTIGNTAENTENIVDTLTNPSEREEYLKQEWLKIINKGPIKNIITFLEKGFTSLNPLWENILGLKFSFSWIFILTLIIFTTLIELTFSISSFISLKLSTYLSNEISPITKWAITIAIIPIIIFIKIPKIIAVLIVSGISSKGPWWLQILGLIFIAIALFYLIRYLEKARRNDIRKIKIGMKKTKRSLKKTSKKLKEKTDALGKIVASREIKNRKKDAKEAEDEEIEKEAEETLGEEGTSTD